MDTQDTSKDEYLRKEFARAFGWIEPRNPYDNYRDPRNPIKPTWEQIFVEVGRMLNRSQTLDNTHHFNALDERMNNLESYINSKKDQIP